MLAGGFGARLRRKLFWSGIALGVLTLALVGSILRLVGVRP
ncbi:MAG TPA: hypothetical protein VH306_11775 [Gaiellaceae bacterium]|jgi:hypothetical protein